MRRPSLVIPSSLAALALAGAVSLVPRTAAAQDSGHAVTLGLTLSYSIGARSAFGIGGDLRYTYYQDAPSGFPYNGSVGFGAFFQPTYLFGGAGRFAFGAHGSFLTNVILDVDTEIGLTFRTKSTQGNTPGGAGVHLGIAPLFNAMVLETGPTFRGSIGFTEGMQSEFIFGGDIRAPGPCNFFACYEVTVGRPLRAEPNAQATFAPLLVGPSEPARPRRKAKGLSRGTRERLLEHWARASSGECASVPAFLALARDLSLAGAPHTLISKARRAAAEEATHTQLCAALANEWSPALLTPELPPLPRNADAGSDALLRRLALDSFWDGCLGEGAAAAEARRTRHFAKDEDTRDTLSVIARDEQGHADLSEQIVAFCISAGGKPVRDALMESVEQARAGDTSRRLDDAEGTTEDTDALAFGVPNLVARRLAREEALHASMRLVSRL